MVSGRGEIRRIRGGRRCGQIGMCTGLRVGGRRGNVGHGGGGGVVDRAQGMIEVA